MSPLSELRKPRTFTTLAALGATAILSVTVLTGCGSSSNNNDASASSTPTKNITSQAAPTKVDGTVNALVPDFPQELIPVIEGAKIQSSTANRTTDPANASLVITSTKPADELMDFYVKNFESKGFKLFNETTSDALISKELNRSDGNEIATISIATEGSGASVQNTVTVGAKVNLDAMK